MKKKNLRDKAEQIITELYTYTAHEMTCGVTNPLTELCTCGLDKIRLDAESFLVKECGFEPMPQNGERTDQ